jgi:hypothetical protein
MKKVMTVALVMMVSASVFAKDPHDVKVLSKMNEVVYFKVSSSMIGASIEVYNEKGQLIYSDQITSKRMLVDFFTEPSGSYTIHLIKDDKEEVIEYVKK